MANMSYCRFQNTLTDLRDCHDHIDDEDLSEEEQKARRELIFTAFRLVSPYLDEEGNLNKDFFDGLD